jgi:predicted alpha/beta-fold hydrolase
MVENEWTTLLIKHKKNITIPVLVIHDKDDPEVPVKKLHIYDHLKMENSY